MVVILKILKKLKNNLLHICNGRGQGVKEDYLILEDKWKEIIMNYNENFYNELENYKENIDHYIIENIEELMIETQ